MAFGKERSLNLEVWVLADLFPLPECHSSDGDSDTITDDVFCLLEYPPGMAARSHIFLFSAVLTTPRSARLSATEQPSYRTGKQCITTDSTAAR